MWCAYYGACRDGDRVEAAILHPEGSGARVLMIAGAMDEAWPPAGSMGQLQSELAKKYLQDDKTIRYPRGSHLTGLMPDREREISCIG